MPTLANVKPGQVLYTVTRQKMGNTTMTRMAVHSVKVIEMLPGGYGVLASWNGNAPRKFFAREVAKWRVNPPKEKKGV